MGVRYRCTNCNYDFEIHSERSVNSCPYCGRKTLKTVSRSPGFSSKIVKGA